MGVVASGEKKNNKDVYTQRRAN